MQRYVLGSVAIVVAGCLPCAAAAGPSRKSNPSAAFDKTVAPVLATTCAPCHNHKLASGGFDAGPFQAPDSLAKQRDGWDRILLKLRNREMPPPGVPRPEAAIDTMLRYVDGELEKADRSAKVDPGRVVAHRLNRTEYANTIRDLLGVEFQARKDFPSDDSGEGFDNIGEILTISPVLMEKYLAAAGRIAARAVAADPLPKPFEVSYAARDKRIQRVDASTIEASHRIDFDGEYTV